MRPGVIFGDTYVRALVAYRGEGLLLEGGDKYEDGPLWFYEAHRGELEIEFTKELTLFGGSGRRIFREQGNQTRVVPGLLKAPEKLDGLFG